MVFSSSSEQARAEDKRLVAAFLFVMVIFAAAFFGIGYYDCLFVLREPDAEPVGLVGLIEHGAMRKVGYWAAGFWRSIAFSLVSLVIGLRVRIRRDSGGR